MARVKASIDDGSWRSPEQEEARRLAEHHEDQRKLLTLGEYAERWLKTRRNSKGKPLAPRTIEERQRLLRPMGTRGVGDPGGALAELVSLPLSMITPERVRTWYASQQERGTITQTARAYELLKAILNTALEDKLIVDQPCTIKGGSTAKTGIQHTPPANEEEFEKLLSAMPEKYKALLVIGGAAGCRYGEATDLRADDITVQRDATGAVFMVSIRIDSGVVQVKGGYIEGKTKTDAVRHVRVLGADAEIIANHVKGLSGKDRLFTAVKSDKPLPQSTFWRHLKKARNAAELPFTRFHDLRHYAGTRYAQSGATLKETMAKLGHTTPAAAMRYQHDGDEARLMQLAAAVARPIPAVTEYSDS